MPHDRRLAVIGLGYVGLPVAVAFGRQGAPVIGFDIDEARTAELKSGCDCTREVEPHDLGHPRLRFTSDPADLSGADFYIVTVPTRSIRCGGRISLRCCGRRELSDKH